jgi:hypothetical protein
MTEHKPRTSRIISFYYHLFRHIPRRFRPRHIDDFVQFYSGVHHNMGEYARAVHDHVRPPRDAELEFVGLQLAELFHYEDFEKLKRGLVGLFADSGRHNVAEVERNISGIGGLDVLIGGGTTHVGTLYPRGAVLPLWSGAAGTLSLPSEVKSIDIKISHILPSVVVVILSVGLHDTVSLHLRSLQQRFYYAEPVIRTDSYLPWKLGFMSAEGSGLRSSEMRMRDEIHDWLSAFQREIEEAVAPHIAGYFVAGNPSAGRRLPAIEIFALKGIPPGDSSLDEWAKEARGWLDSLELLPDYEPTYQAGHLLYTPAFARIPYPPRRVAHRVLVDWSRYMEHFEEHAKAIPTGHSGKSYLLRRFEILDDLSSILALTDALKSARQRVQELRQNVFRAVHHRGGMLNKQVAVYYMLQRESLLLERVTTELTSKLGVFDWHLRSSKEMKLTYPAWQRDLWVQHGIGNTLEDTVSREIAQDTRLLQQHIALMQAHFSDYLSTYNMDVTYRLQSQVHWLTMVALILAVVSLAFAFVSALAVDPNEIGQHFARYVQAIIDLVPGP